MKSVIAICECGSPYVPGESRFRDGCENCKRLAIFASRITRGRVFAMTGTPRKPFETFAIERRRKSWRDSKRRARGVA